jgi:Tfp pilus assembly protein PilF
MDLIWVYGVGEDAVMAWSACSTARLGSQDTQGSARRRADKKIGLAVAIMKRSQGRFAMKAVADTLAAARSNLIERVSRRVNTWALSQVR